MNAARALLLTVVCAALLAGEAQARAGRAGVVTAWGVDDIPLVEPGTRFKAVAVGVQGMGLTTEGRIVAWSINGGQEPPSLGPVAGIAAGGEHNLALKSDSAVGRKRAAANSMFHGPTAVAHPPRRQSSARSAMSIVQRVAWAKLRQERHIRIARSRGQRAAPGGA
jgi:hypothetical protein